MVTGNGLSVPFIQAAPHGFMALTDSHHWTAEPVKPGQFQNRPFRLRTIAQYFDWQAPPWPTKCTDKSSWNLLNTMAVSDLQLDLFFILVSFPFYQKKSPHFIIPFSKMKWILNSAISGWMMLILGLKHFFKTIRQIPYLCSHCYSF
jgi:hypothetical protein